MHQWWSPLPSLRCRRVDNARSIDFEGRHYEIAATLRISPSKPLFSFVPSRNPVLNRSRQ